RTLTSPPQSASRPTCRRPSTWSTAPAVRDPVAVTWDTKGLSWDTPGTIVAFGHGTDANGQPFATATVIVTVANVSSVDPASVNDPIRHRCGRPRRATADDGPGPARSDRSAHPPLPVTRDTAGTPTTSSRTRGR